MKNITTLFRMFLSHKTEIVIFILAFLATWGWNSLNINLIEKYSNEPAYAIKSDLLLSGIDDVYYVTPAENLSKGYGLKRDPGVSSGDYYRRTPGYSLFYYSFMVLFENPQTLALAIRLTQTALFALSAVFVYLILFNLFEVKKGMSSLTALVYGCLPSFSAFTANTLTEALTVPLVPVFIFFYFKYIKLRNAQEPHGQYYLLLAGLFWISLVMIRPLMGVLIVIPLIDLVLFFFKKPLKNWRHGLVFLLFPILFFSIWTIRNYKIDGNIVFLEKTSHPESLDLYKPFFFSYVKLLSIYGVDHNVARQWHDKYREGIYQSKGIHEAYIDEFISCLPVELIEITKRDTLESYLNLFGEIILIQQPFFESVQALPSEYSDKEMEFVEFSNRIIEKNIEANKFQYYFLSPLSYLKMAILHSNTGNIFLFQKEMRNKFIVFNLIRIGLVFFHIGLWLVSFILLVNMFRVKFLIYGNMLIGICPFLILILLSFYFKAMEQRYLLPFLSLLLIFVISALNLKRRRTQ